ncbi:hypothetical protein F1K75_18560, partial [Vibrio cholerae]|nr:hypothetical protein [Vibrio cholerae]
MLINSDNLDAMKTFIKNVQDFNLSDEGMNFLLKSSATILSRIVSNPDKWNESCAWNRERLGSQLIERLSNVGNINVYVEEIFLILYNFACEFIFTGERDFQIEELLRSIDARGELFSVQLNAKINYARYSMPVEIVKRFLNEPDVQCFKAFPELSSKALFQKNELETTLNEKIREVEHLKNSLDKYKDAFNFVGLHQGFGSILKMKQSEQSKLLKFIIFLGGILLIPMLFTIFLKAKAQFVGSWSDISFLLPLMSLE